MEIYEITKLSGLDEKPWYRIFAVKRGDTLYDLLDERYQYKYNKKTYKKRFDEKELEQLSDKNTIFYREAVKLTPNESVKATRYVKKRKDADAALLYLPEKPTWMARYKTMLHNYNEEQRTHNYNLEKWKIYKKKQKRYNEMCNEICKAESERNRREAEKERLRFQKLENAYFERREKRKKVKEIKSNQLTDDKYFAIELPSCFGVNDGKSDLYTTNYYDYNYKTHQEDKKEYSCPALAKVIDGRLYDIKTGDEYCVPELNIGIDNEQAIKSKSIRGISKEKVKEHLKKLERLDISGRYERNLEEHFRIQIGATEKDYEKIKRQRR